LPKDQAFTLQQSWLCEIGAMRAKEILSGALMLGAVGGYAWSTIPPAVTQSPFEHQRIEHSTYYSGCDEVRAAGKAPLYAGQPGYREGMDGDDDGIACEPIRH
jgi:hypothetical protein